MGKVRKKLLILLLKRLKHSVKQSKMNGMTESIGAFLAAETYLRLNRMIGIKKSASTEENILWEAFYYFH